ncbi:MAG: HNH endonuclease [Eikenella sp.]|nr:HNH endonuclease [Eikenella sp.]
MAVITVKDTDPVDAHLNQIKTWRRDAKKYQPALYDLLSDTVRIIDGLLKEGKTYREGWTLNAADAAFSRAVRARAGYRCEKCGKQYAPGDTGLQCSHHYSRRHHAIRYHPDNAAALCHHCHNYWFSKDIAEAAEWLRQRLGEEKLAELARLKAEGGKRLTALQEAAAAEHFDLQAIMIAAGQTHIEPWRSDF